MAQVAPVHYFCPCGALLDGLVCCAGNLGLGVSKLSVCLFPCVVYAIFALVWTQTVVLFFAAFFCYGFVLCCFAAFAFFLFSFLYFEFIFVLW